MFPFLGDAGDVGDAGDEAPVAEALILELAAPEPTEPGLLELVGVAEAG